MQPQSLPEIQILINTSIASEDAEMEEWYDVWEEADERLPSYKEELQNIEYKWISYKISYRGSETEELYLPKSLKEWLPMSIFDHSEETSEDVYEIWYEHTSEAESNCGCQWTISMTSAMQPPHWDVDLDDMSCTLSAPNRTAFMLEELEVWQTASKRCDYFSNLELLVSAAQDSDADLSLHSDSCALKKKAGLYISRKADGEFGVLPDGTFTEIVARSSLPYYQNIEPAIRCDETAQLLFVSRRDHVLPIPERSKEILDAAEQGNLFYIMPDPYPGNEPMPDIARILYGISA